ncbi:cytochrome-c peroxidase [Marinospirillum alkaliphilum]|uniref:Cytochrome c peroxidase n=1 Tax=Marinospirillum alkaliphilum DSM 21637 TaxID=1122209 RepID=A0A1K1UAM3_9GAMM|nr:cytochrome c peroxidase [Marinospirillum alkaliphilum]SFX09832.1 cytochrome c peroxidase [Marinospirillum alkaliphilum DSM 21637]
MVRYICVIHCLLILSLPLSAEMITPVPQPPKIDPAILQLGQQLFHDTRLSRDGDISCASCHDLSRNGADQQPLSRGTDGALGKLRSPSVYNAALNAFQFWDGRARTLEEQVDGPLHDPVEMASNWPDVMARLQQDQQLVASFSAIYPAGLTPETLRSALADFQRSLLTTNAPFDRWLQGDADAITAQQQHGFRLFRDYGCISCHQGANVGGNLFARMGSLENYFALKGDAIQTTDLGRYNVTGRESHRHVFKVPGLRTAALNSHFFHDGSVDNLEEAIRVMARFQLGRQLTDDEVVAMADFIQSLTGQHPFMDEGAQHEKR